MFSFSKKFKLFKFSHFDLIFRKNKKIVFKELIIFWMKNKFKYPRIGIFLSRNIIRKSYQRNRIKRLIREFFRLNKRKISFVDLIILPKKEIIYLNNKKINNRLRILFDIFLKKN